MVFFVVVVVFVCRRIVCYGCCCCVLGLKICIYLVWEWGGLYWWSYCFVEGILVGDDFFMLFGLFICSCNFLVIVMRFLEMVYKRGFWYLFGCDLVVVYGLWGVCIWKLMWWWLFGCLVYCWWFILWIGSYWDLNLCYFGWIL